jgi:hypothetical protein
MSPNVTYSISLKSYHPYLEPQKVSKNPKIYCIHSNLSKNAKSHFGSLDPLGVKRYFVFVFGHQIKKLWNFGKKHTNLVNMDKGSS